MTTIAERDAEILRLSAAGAKRGEIVRRLGVTRAMVDNARKAAKLAARTPGGAALDGEIVPPAAVPATRPEARPETRPESRAHFASAIATIWRQAAQAFFQAGDLLTRAKAALPHGEFEAMVASDLPFGPTTARRLMIIARDTALRAHVHVLPPHWGTLYELTKLDPETRAARLADGTIRPEMERREIAQVRKRLARGVREELLGRAIAALPERRYGVILADPEWRFQVWSRASGLDRAADNHYPTSPLEAIKARPVGDLAAEHCALFLWATAPMLPEALEVMRAWGFAYRTHVVWRKTRPLSRPSPDGEGHPLPSNGEKGGERAPSELMLGTGYWFRCGHELLLLGVKGDVPAPAMGEQFPSVIDHPPLKHSQKPERFLELIEAYFPSVAKIELNRRGPARPGWDAWGNEAEDSRDSNAVVIAGLDPAIHSASAATPSEGNGMDARIRSGHDEGGCGGAAAGEAMEAAE